MIPHIVKQNFETVTQYFRHEDEDLKWRSRTGDHRNQDPTTQVPKTQRSEIPEFRTQDQGTRTWDPGPRTLGLEFLELYVYNFFWRFFTFNFSNFLNCLMSTKIPSHEAYYIMYSVFLVIFEKHVLLLNFNVKRWKVRNHLQINVIKQSTPSHIFHTLITEIKLIILFLREWKRNLFSTVANTNTSTTNELAGTAEPYPFSLTTHHMSWKLQT